MDSKIENIEAFITEYLSGSMNEDELTELIGWIGQSKENEQYFNDFRQTWLASSILSGEKKYNENAAFNRFQTRIIHKEIKNNGNGLKRRINISVWQAAASIILIISLGLATLLFAKRTANNGSQELTNQTIVPLGSKSQVILPDGSVVTLNAGSKLTYDIATFSTLRHVNLVGEGYFKVKSSKDVPFIVNASGINVKATGTEFNVKAYPDENYLETILIEGVVEIGNSDETKNRLTLKPNERFIYIKKKNISLIDTDDENLKGKEFTLPNFQSDENTVLKYIETHLDPKALTSWKEENWKIDRETLKFLAVKLERKYDVKITFADEELKKFRFNGTLQDESLEQVLNAMSLTSPIKYEIKGKDVIFYEDKKEREKYKDLYISN